MPANPPTSSGDSPVGPNADDASMHLLAEMALDALVDDAMPPCILRFRRLGADIEFGSYPLDGTHPSGYLLGFRPDDDCFALGVAAHGWAYHVADRARPDPARTRVRLVSVVSRSGEHAHLTRTDDEDHPLNGLDGHAPSGEQIDLLRRALDLPTDPPPCDTATYWAIEWLSAIVDLAGSDDALMDWTSVQHVHPAATLLTAGGADPGDHDFVEMAASFARVCDWPRIRTLVDRGTYRAAGLRPGDGDWFDDGSLARYLLARCPPLPALRAAAADIVTTDARARIEETLSAIGVPDTVWPDLGSSAA